MPEIETVIAYRKGDRSTTVRDFLATVDAVIADGAAPAPA
jgi:hypothetical protein